MSTGRRDATQATADSPRTLFVHVHLFDLAAVQDLDRHLVAGQNVLSHLDLQQRGPTLERSS
jgi:hypothetical protein